MADMVPAAVKLTELTANVVVEPLNTVIAWPTPFGPVTTNPELAKLIVTVVVR